MNLESSLSYAFVLKLTDQPGGMEIVAAAFAHRGVSLTGSLGSDGALDPAGRATILVTFTATPAKKEIIRRALGRLARVRSLVEHPMDSPRLRKTAMFRVSADAPAPRPGVEEIAVDPATGERTHFFVHAPAVVDAYLAELRAGNWLQDVTTTVVAL